MMTTNIKLFRYYEMSQTRVRELERQLEEETALLEHAVGLLSTLSGERYTVEDIRRILRRKSQ